MTRLHSILQVKSLTLMCYSLLSCVEACSLMAGTDSRILADFHRLNFSDLNPETLFPLASYNWELVCCSCYLLQIDSISLLNWTCFGSQGLSFFMLLQSSSIYLRELHIHLLHVRFAQSFLLSAQAHSIDLSSWLAW